MSTDVELGRPGGCFDDFLCGQDIYEAPERAIKRLLTSQLCNVFLKHQEVR